MGDMFCDSCFLLCREFRKKMEAAKTRVHTLKKKQREAEKTAEVVNSTQTGSKRQVAFLATCLCRVSIVL